MLRLRRQDLAKPLCAWRRSRSCPERSAGGRRAAGERFHLHGRLLSSSTVVAADAHSGPVTTLLRCIKGTAARATLASQGKTASCDFLHAHKPATQRGGVHPEAQVRARAFLNSLAKSSMSNQQVQH